MNVARLSEAYSDLLAAAPAKLLETPGMLSREERAFLYNLARTRYSGEGVIIDAGLFLGASTLCFGNGLRDNPALPAAVARFGRPIRSFELARVAPKMARLFDKHGIGTDLRPGDSFEPLLRRIIAPIADLVDLRAGDILEHGCVQEPIEILFLDVVKHPKIADFAVKQYFPRLIPNVSIVIQQDYNTDKLPYIKSMQEAFSDHFEFIGAARASSIFLCRSAITAEQASGFAVQNLPGDRQLQLAQQALQRAVSEPRRFMLSLSCFRTIHRVQGAGAATDYLNGLRSEFPVYWSETAMPRMRKAVKDAEEVLTGKDRSRTPEQIADAAVAELRGRLADMQEAKANRLARRAAETAERQRQRQASA